MFIGFVALCAVCGHGAPPAADDILSYVRANLPSDPLTLTGTLKVRAKNGFIKTNLPVRMELNWGAPVPAAHYRIGDESLDIAWPDKRPRYTFSSAATSPASHIPGTGVTWADLSFSMLWWPGPRLAGEEKKINRDCYVVDVPVPGSKNTMRLWIEKNMGMLLEAQTFDPTGRQLRLMRIKSIKKMDGMWVAKDLEIRNKESGDTTTLQITDLEWNKTEETP